MRACGAISEAAYTIFFKWLKQMSARLLLEFTDYVPQLKTDNAKKLRHNSNA